MSENIFIVSVVLKNRQQPINLYYDTREKAKEIYDFLTYSPHPNENKSTGANDDYGKEVDFGDGQIQTVAIIDADLDFAAQEILAIKETRKQARIRNKMGSDPAFRMVKGMPIVGGNN